MRGKLRHSHPSDIPAGITPAHAGKTVTQSLKRSASGDHPRACGENEDNFRGFNYRLGSPPRMRGKPRRYSDSCINNRITPAHAGKTEFLFC